MWTITISILECAMTTTISILECKKQAHTRVVSHQRYKLDLERPWVGMRVAQSISMLPIPQQGMPNMPHSVRKDTHYSLQQYNVLLQYHIPHKHPLPQPVDQLGGGGGHEELQKSHGSMQIKSHMVTWTPSSLFAQPDRAIDLSQEFCDFRKRDKYTSRHD